MDMNIDNDLEREADLKRNKRWRMKSLGQSNCLLCRIKVGRLEFNSAWDGAEAAAHGMELGSQYLVLSSLVFIQYNHRSVVIHCFIKKDFCSSNPSS